MATAYYYVAVKASLHSSDCDVFGLVPEEVSALSKRFSNSHTQISNGVTIKGPPIEVINALCQLGYKVTSTTGAVPSVQQSLDELDFERGIWSAALNGEEERVRKLLDKGTKPDELDAAGYTALHYAARAGHVSIARLLLAAGADVNAVTRAGRATSLHRAASAGHTNIACLLLEYGANVDAVDADGQTALHRAAQGSQEAFVQYIVRIAPHLSAIRDVRGRLPQDCATPHVATLLTQ